MKTIYLLGRCLGHKNGEFNTKEFHFKGVYLGEKINKVLLCDPPDEFIPNNDYLVHLQVQSIQNGVLFGLPLSKKSFGSLEVDEML